MKKIVISILILFLAIQGIAQIPLTKKEIKNIKKTVVCDEPDYSFMMVHEDKEKNTMLNRFNEGEIYFLCIGKEEFIFVKDTIIPFQEENLSSEKITSLKNCLNTKIILKNYFLHFLPEDKKTFIDVNRRRAIMAYENGCIIDFQCQRGVSEYDLLKYLSKKIKKSNTKKERR